MSARDRTQRAWMTATKAVESSRGRGIRGKVDEQPRALSTGKAQRLHGQPQRAYCGVFQTGDCLGRGRQGAGVPAAREGLPRLASEFLSEHVDERVALAQLMEPSDLAVCDVAPIRVELVSLRVGERVPEQVGRVLGGLLEESERTGQLVVHLVPGKDISEVVDDSGRHLSELVEDGPDGGPHRSTRSVCGRAGAELRALADGGQLLQVDAVGLAEPEGVCDCREDLGRRTSVASLFEPGEVVDADAGEGRQLGPPKTGGASSQALGQPDVGRSDLVTTAANEVAKLSVDHSTSVPPRDDLWVAPPGPASSRSPTPGHAPTGC